MGVGVLRLDDVDPTSIGRLLSRYGIELTAVPPEASIPGSYWGDSEAGLIENRLYARGDTPIHSVLHEAAHFVCMSPSRRACLMQDAGGDDAEESAVCYLQVLLSDHIPEMDRERLFCDMDAWGYSFRLGSTRRWFEEDGPDRDGALNWLRDHGLVDAKGAVDWKLREDSP